MFLNTYTLQWNLSGGFLGNDYDIEIFLQDMQSEVKYPSGGLLDDATNFLASSSISPKISVLCKNITLSGKNVTTAELHHRGRKYIVPGEEEYSGTLELEYYNDRELTTRNFFMNWINAVKNTQKNVLSPYITVTPKTKKAAVDLVGSNTTSQTFMGIFPTAISDLSLDGTNTTELTTSTITLAYSVFKTDNEEGGLTSLF